ncbi:hypothetical protein L7E55_15495 [Pelotomaculum isophthalicicum JI]|uniref:Uncharacterized protein n=1 Tax=Pelotomaculum isophthalicicum JI TaxID=947010 RepID=A0A9X4H4D9_9FIRM|nr:hypothetical protein [Pelotomaculum isophthalicicum]MDF9409736.1 hypothetical protein [Pelotomaculum isophthalicicum JI]
MKVARRAKFLKEYWNIKDVGNNFDRQNGEQKTMKDVAVAINESERTTQRLLKLKGQNVPLELKTLKDVAAAIGDDDPMKVARRAKFLKEYWEVERGGDRKSKGQNVPLKTLNDVAAAIGEDERTTKRLLKLNDLILPLQNLISAGKLGM